MTQSNNIVDLAEFRQKKDSDMIEIGIFGDVAFLKSEGLTLEEQEHIKAAIIESNNFDFMPVPDAPAIFDATLFAMAILGYKIQEFDPRDLELLRETICSLLMRKTNRVHPLQAFVDTYIHDVDSSQFSKYDLSDINPDPSNN